MRKCVVALAALVLAGCGPEEKTSRGLEIMPDMFHSPAFESQQALVGKDGVQRPALLHPPAGSVSRSGPGHTLAANDWAGAKALASPLSPTLATLRAGQKAYMVVCASCHGRDGNAANTSMGAFFSGIPSVNGANIANLSDGELYHIQTVGRGRMPGFSGQLLPESRWAVVLYLRALSRASIVAAAPGEVVSDAWTNLKGDDQGMPVLEVRKADLEALAKAGTGSDFLPLPEPVPEYQPRTWPVPAPAAGGHP